jgi:hypothetical protein
VITEVYDEENSEAKEEDAEQVEREEVAEEKREEEARKKRHNLGLHSDDESDDEEEAAHPSQLTLDDLDGGPGLGLKLICKSIIEASWFNPFFVVLIVTNTIVLAMEYDGMSKGYSDGLTAVNIALSVAFMVELVLKVVALGVTEYSRDRFNLFDAVVVVMSIVELAVASSGSLSALRAFRILRVLKLIRTWRSLQKFLYTIYLTVLDLGNFSFIVGLTIFIFALLGMQVFGGKMCGLGDDGEVPRHHFDTLLWALVTVFQVLTGEDWNAVMYDAMAASGSWAALYFVALLVIGNFLVLNLFVAILLTNFGAQDVSSEYESAHLLEGVKFFKVGSLACSLARTLARIGGKSPPGLVPSMTCLFGLCLCLVWLWRLCASNRNPTLPPALELVSSAPCDAPRPRAPVLRGV